MILDNMKKISYFYILICHGNKQCYLYSHKQDLADYTSTPINPFAWSTNIIQLVCPYSRAYKYDIISLKENI